MYGIEPIALFYVTWFLIGSLSYVLYKVYKYFHGKLHNNSFDQSLLEEDAEDIYWGHFKCKACGGRGPPSTKWGSLYMYDHACNAQSRARKAHGSDDWIISPTMALKRQRKYAPPCPVCHRRRRLKTGKSVYHGFKKMKKPRRY